MLQTTPTDPAALARRPDTAGPLAVATPTTRRLAAVRFRAKLSGQPDPAGEATARVLGGYRRTAADRGRGVESHTTAQRRGRLDAVIASLLFMGGLRRSEVSALEWRDVADASDGDGVLLTVRTSKTNQEGDAAAAAAAPTDRVIGLSPLQIQRRFTAAARAAPIARSDSRARCASRGCCF